MLRITVVTEERRTVLKVEGELVGPRVEELKRCWILAKKGMHNEPIQIDLTNVTLVDSHATELIREMCHKEVELQVVGPLISSIVDEVREELRHTQFDRIREVS